MPANYSTVAIHDLRSEVNAKAAHISQDFLLSAFITVVLAWIVYTTVFKKGK